MGVYVNYSPYPLYNNTIILTVEILSYDALYFRFIYNSYNYLTIMYKLQRPDITKETQNFRITRNFYTTYRILPLAHLSERWYICGYGAIQRVL